MFYTAELLSFRKKGKLAPCWFAAMSTTQAFKKFYNAAIVKKIDVTITCEEILQVIQLRSRGNRFSLYLSAQLMYGITRILSYQIDYYQKELLEIWKIFYKKKTHDDFNGDESFEILPDLPLMNKKYIDRQIIEKDLHILPGEIPDDALKMCMQDATCLNFGELTSEEMDFMLKHDAALDIRQMIIDDNEHRNVTEMTTDVEIATEVHREMHSFHEVLSPRLIDRSKIIDKSKGKSPSTPKKRQPCQPHVETPSKRRRISLENIGLPVADIAVNVTHPPLPDIPIPEEVVACTLSVKNTIEMAPSQHVNISMELESLHLSLNTFIARTKKLIIDKHIVLADTILKKWHQNINFTCREMEIPRIHKISSNDLLTRPSRYCAQSLCNLFVNHTKKPCKSANEDIAPIFTQYQEEVRGQRTLQRTIEDTGPITSKIIDIEQPSIEQLNTIPIHTAIWIDEPPRQETRADMDDSNVSLEDIDILLKKMEFFTTKDQISLPLIRSNDKSPHPFRDVSHDRSPDLSRDPLLTSKDIMATLEVLWHDKSYVKFSDLIPKDAKSKPNIYTKHDAATVFCILLELQSQKKLVLSQREFYRTLWIMKYEDYSS